MSDLPPVDYNARLHKLLDTINADAVALVPGPNLFYFTGLNVHLSERPTMAVVTREGLSFVIPQLEMIKITQRPDLEARPFIWSDTDGYRGSFEALGQSLKGQRVAVDGMTMRVFEWKALGGAGIDLSTAVDAGQDLLNIRAIKTPDEVAAMQTAIRMSETALTHLMDWVQPGMSENQIAARLSDEMTAAGIELMWFNLVLAGANAALPHGHSGSRIVNADDFLLIDYGGSYQNYPSDITRTFCLGTPTEEMKRVYEAVRGANEAARLISKPGVPCGDVDKAARDVIEAAGYGEYFTHRTGHGLGLSGHELPQIAANVTDVLKPGMVFTIEPGIYLPERFGVRIEDDMHVTEDGCESLTTYPRELSNK